MAATRTLEDVKRDVNPPVAVMLLSMEYFHRRAVDAEKMYLKAVRREVRSRKKYTDAEMALLKAEADMRAAGLSEHAIEEQTEPYRKVRYLAEKIWREDRADARAQEQKAANLHRNSTLLAEKAAPYVSPKLAAIDKRVTTESTSVNVNVNTTAKDLLTECGDALRELVGSGLGPPPRRIQADGDGEPVHPGQATQEAADDAAGPQ